MKEIREYLSLLIVMLLLALSIVLIDSRLKTVMSESVTSQKTYTVVIDAGHGGFDSGKVGVDGTLEKDVNLSIAKKLEQLLIQADVNVIMTRDLDESLDTADTSNKKRQDMNSRVSLMNEQKPDCIISIHQNSYPDEAVDGAQVFYYTGSAAGRDLAVLLQELLITSVDPSNHRKEKADSSYYLLKNATAPIVIVECGFLSNWEESKKLVDDAYQHKLAWAIHLGVLQYLNSVRVNLHT